MSKLKEFLFGGFTALIVMGTVTACSSYTKTDSGFKFCLLCMDGGAHTEHETKKHE